MQPPPPPFRSLLLHDDLPHLHRIPLSVSHMLTEFVRTFFLHTVKLHQHLPSGRKAKATVIVTLTGIKGRQSVHMCTYGLCVHMPMHVQMSVCMTLHMSLCLSTCWCLFSPALLSLMYYKSMWTGICAVFTVSPSSSISFTIFSFSYSMQNCSPVPSYDS